MAEYIVDTTDGILNAKTTGRIVRCRDCEHSYEHSDARGRWLLCNLSTYREVEPDGFCSWARRRRDGTRD